MSGMNWTLIIMFLVMAAFWVVIYGVADDAARRRNLEMTMDIDYRALLEKFMRFEVEEVNGAVAHYPMKPSRDFTQAEIDYLRSLQTRVEKQADHDRQDC